MLNQRSTIEKQFYTYLHCKPDGVPFYVGKGHGGRAKVLSRRNAHHTNTVRRYGANNIKVYVFYCDSEEQAFLDERHQIRQLRQEGIILANKTDGGEGCSGLIVSAETRAKMSASQTGLKRPPTLEHRRKLAEAALGRKASMETRIKLSKAMLGNTIGVGNKNCVGRTYSAESIAKMSASHTGKVISAHTRELISAIHKGKPKSESTKALMSKATIGIPKPKNTVCPNCGKYGDAGNMAKYHFSKCKFLNQ